MSVPLLDALVIVGPSLASARSALSSSVAGGALSLRLPPKVLSVHAPLGGAAELPFEALVEFTFPRGHAQVRRVVPPTAGSPAGAQDPALSVLADGAYHRTLFGAHALRRGPRSHVFLLLGAEGDPAATRFCFVLEALQPLCAGGVTGTAPRRFVIISRAPAFAVLHEFARCIVSAWQRAAAARLLAAPIGSCCAVLSRGVGPCAIIDSCMCGVDAGSGDVIRAELEMPRKQSMSPLLPLLPLAEGTPQVFDLTRAAAAPSAADVPWSHPLLSPLQRFLRSSTAAAAMAAAEAESGSDCGVSPSDGNSGCCAESLKFLSWLPTDSDACESRAAASERALASPVLARLCSDFAAHQIPLSMGALAAAGELSPRPATTIHIPLPATAVPPIAGGTGLIWRSGGCGGALTSGKHTRRASAGKEMLHSYSASKAAMLGTVAELRYRLPSMPSLSAPGQTGGAELALAREHGNGSESDAGACSLHSRERLAAVLLAAAPDAAAEAAGASSGGAAGVGASLIAPAARAALTAWAAPALLSLLPPLALLRLVAAVLTERKVVLVAGCLSLEAVGSCALALAALVAPLAWAGPLLPVLPAALADVLAAPMPVLVGVATLPPGFVPDSQTVLARLDEGSVSGDGDAALTLPDADVLLRVLSPAIGLLGRQTAAPARRAAPLYAPSPAQAAAAAEVVGAIGSHVRRLLARVARAGAAQQRDLPSIGGKPTSGAFITARISTTCNCGGAAPLGADQPPLLSPLAELPTAVLTPHAVDMLPSFAVCAAAALDGSAAGERPFVAGFLSTQMAAAFFSARLDRLRELAVHNSRMRALAAAPRMRAAPLVTQTAENVLQVISCQALLDAKAEHARSDKLSTLAKVAKGNSRQPTIPMIPASSVRSTPRPCLTLPSTSPVVADSPIAADAIRPASTAQTSLLRSSVVDATVVYAESRRSAQKSLTQMPTASSPATSAMADPSTSQPGRLRAASSMASLDAAVGGAAALRLMSSFKQVPALKTPRCVSHGDGNVCSESIAETGLRDYIARLRGSLVRQLRASFADSVPTAALAPPSFPTPQSGAQPTPLPWRRLLRACDEVGNDGASPPSVVPEVWWIA